MRFVAVTDGDKVSRRGRNSGYSVNTHGVGDLVAAMNDVGDDAITRLCVEYEDTYRVADVLRKGGGAPRRAPL